MTTGRIMLVSALVAWVGIMTVSASGSTEPWYLLGVLVAAVGAGGCIGAAMALVRKEGRER